MAHYHVMEIVMAQEETAKIRSNVEDGPNTIKRSDGNRTHGVLVIRVQLTKHMYESTISKTRTSTLWHNNTMIREGRTDTERQRQTRMRHGMATYWTEEHSKHQSKKVACEA